MQLSKTSFVNIWGLHSNFGECESFLELNAPGILALIETNLDESIDFSVRDYPSLIQKDSITHLHGLAVHVNCRFELSAVSSSWTAS